MTFWLALRRLLPLLAVLSLALTPVTAHAATAGMLASMGQGHHTPNPADSGMAGMDHAAMGHYAAMAADMSGMDMDDMPCCPKPAAAKPDCAKGCPLMALCLASVASLLPAAVPVPVPVAIRASASWPTPATFASVHGTPYPEPPRA
ncbi:hypothetical protein [Methylobacterium dankookense]|uniref:Uncharacterized protein n=1 Tax=Methylobacterium dankookense TaxID=560405 RepID=A0A564FUE1_9HYPH|nr:hypothetical protein [Methylobacterium dankookense]GJD54833.1 hypothetical protein IFDJLNFL_0712 [Methylobacterium dankookense]VUF11051.1 hypothetical protein MTDSW087_00724 [Methylobacterium dankookense]